MTGGSDQAREAPVSLKTWIGVSGALRGAFLAVLNMCRCCSRRRAIGSPSCSNTL